jgi:alpha-beta hydrolase superfamily lysophospholipase
MKQPNALAVHCRRLLALLALAGLPALACSAPVAPAETTTTTDPLVRSDECPAQASSPSWIRTRTLVTDGAKLRIGSIGGGARGDVLYLHGFADRFDNHRPLLDAFVASGLRVITFDYPSHGESCGDTIGTFGFTGLANLAGKVVAELGDASKPLYLAGWSTGGLLAVRMAQGVGSTLDREIAAMALFAPGVDVQTFSPATNPVSGVTNATLTRNPNPPHAGPPKPSWVGAVPAFATELLTNEQLSGAQLPSRIPTLVIVGGDREDRYADTRGIVAWTERQDAGGASMHGLRCAGGYHELDNEPEPMGRAVRSAAATFLASGGASGPAGSGGCAPF